MNPHRLLAAIAALLVAIGGITLAITSDDDGQGHKRTTVSIHVDGVDADTKADDKVVLSQEAQDQLDAVEQTAKIPNADEILPGADGQPPTGAELADSLREPLDHAAAVLPPLAGAAQDWPGCRTQFVRNESYRTAGIRLGAIFEHYTVSADTPGWADNDALTARANDPVAGVSWHFQIGRKDGNCTYNVPISMKAWHAAGANSASIGIEIHALGNEGTYVEGAGKTRLAKVVREIERRTGIPNQIGQGHCVGSTFVVTKPGLFRHVDGGLCSGGHIDTNPFADPRPMTIAAVNALDLVPITAKDRGRCHKIAAFHKKPARYRRAHRRYQEARWKRNRKRGLYCDGRHVRRRHK